MRSTVVLILALLPAVGMGREAVGPAQTPAPGYQLGERLKPAPHAPGRAATRFKEIGWDALVPTSWKPAKIFEGLDLSNLRDGDPRAMRALARLRDEWEKAPVNPAMNGAAVRIPGFVVPLETAGKDLPEFLLVPYFGPAYTPRPRPPIRSFTFSRRRPQAMLPA